MRSGRSTASPLRLQQHIRHISSFISLLVVLLGATVLQAATRDKHAGAPSIAGRLPLAFEANQGQQDPSVRFLARGPSYNLYFSRETLALALQDEAHMGDQAKNYQAKGAIITIDLFHANPAVRVVGLNELSEKTNYFIGNDPTNWRTGIQTYARVKYEDVYSGIDLIFYGKGDKVEYDFVVKPGAHPRDISLLIHGSEAVSIDHDGSLIIRTQAGPLRFRRPVLYQEIAQRRTHVDGRFVVSETSSQEGRQFFVSFHVGAYDRARQLVIDPILDYSTYLGGSGSDYTGGMARDSLGNTYVVGTTTSLDFPVTAGVKQRKCAGTSCQDIFIAKLNPTGSGLIYATYLGGSAADIGVSIATDSSGNAYITGATQSTDFPTTVGALKRTCGGTCFNRDAFVAKLNSTGSALVYSTYLGGSDEDFAGSIRVLNGNAYVSGFSGSTDFPTTAGAYKTQLEGQGSSFVAQLNSTGKALVFSTFVGEVDLQDAAPALALDSNGNSYLLGDTLSSNYPVSAGSFHTPLESNLNSNLYITKLNPTGTALVFSALIGGAGPSGGISTDGIGNIYFAAAAGDFFPVTPNAIEQSCPILITNGNSNGILIRKLSADGTHLLAAGHVCPDRAWPSPVGFDAAGNLITAGYTDSPLVPTTVNAFQKSIRNICCFSDGFIMRLTPDATMLTYSTYLGGNSADAISAFITDSTRDLYLVGGTSSTNFPTVNAFQPALAGGNNAFISKMTLPITKLSVFPAALNFNSQGVGLASSPIEITVGNVSTASIPISQISVTGDFSATSNCGLELPAQARCTTLVSFKPTTAGKRSGVLTLTDGLGSQRVTLSGTGVNGPVLKFAPIPIINEPNGASSPPITITMTNIGNSNLVIDSLESDNGSEFLFVGKTTCFTPVPPGGSCSTQLSFRPFGTFGRDFTVFTVSDNTKTGSDSVLVAANGLGAGLGFTVTGARFFQQTVGTKGVTQQIGFVNGSGAAVTISGFKVSPNFTQTHTCGTTLAAGAFCYVNVAFKPTTKGILQGSVTITDNGPGSPHVLPLIGTGK